MKNFIITGAGSGIGQALALKLANLGHRVLAVGRRLSHLQQTQASYPEQIDVLAVDITQSTAHEKIGEWAGQASGILNLIHNAATAEPLGLLKDLSSESFRYQQSLNLEAPLFLTKKLLPYLTNGRILHISSGLAHFYCPGAAGYCISKAAFFMLYQCWREELKDQNIAVGSAEPGAVDTPMQSTLRQQDKTALPVVDSFIRFKESGDLLPPAVVADFLSWLLLSTSVEDFSHAEWSISDRSHHSHWLRKAGINWDLQLS